MIRLLNRFDDEHIIGFYDGDENERKKDISDITSSFLSIYDIEGEIVPTEDTGILCGYDYSRNRILLNNQNALKESVEFARRIKTLDDEYYTYFINYYYLYIINYGLMHLAQSKMYGEESQDNILRYLYDISRECSQDGLVSCNQKILTPMEVEANNRARHRAYLLMRSTKLPMKKCEILRYHFLNMLLEYYEEDGIPPIDRIAAEYDNIDLDRIEELMGNARMTTKAKMNLGLEVDPRVLSYVTKRRDKVLAKINKDGRVA